MARSAFSSPSKTAGALAPLISSATFASCTALVAPASEVKKVLSFRKRPRSTLSTAALSFWTACQNCLARGFAGWRAASFELRALLIAYPTARSALRIRLAAEPFVFGGAAAAVATDGMTGANATQTDSHSTKACVASSRWDRRIGTVTGWNMAPLLEICAFARLIAGRGMGVFAGLYPSGNRPQPLPVRLPRLARPPSAIVDEWQLFVLSRQAPELA